VGVDGEEEGDEEEKEHVRVHGGMAGLNGRGMRDAVRMETLYYGA